MEYVRLGRSGMKVSRVILGSWLTFGSSVGADTTADCVRAALDLGIQTFDTADVYARGEAELVLGQALAGLRRSDLVLVLLQSEIEATNPSHPDYRPEVAAILEEFLTSGT